LYTYHPTKKNGKPHRGTKNKPPWRIALIANLKDEFEADIVDPPDAGAEFDRLGTIEAIAAALESDGHWVHFLQGDHTLPEALINLRPQICFNLAEGLSGNGREAQVPALCELLGIPYTASGVVPHAIGLDKTQTKRIWRDHGLPTAPFQEFTSLAELGNIQLHFPLFVKPAREGTGMGIDEKAVVSNPDELYERVDWVLRTYRQPALVEEFLSGREFTVGFIGNPGSPALRRRPELYDQDGYHWFPILEIDTHTSVSPTVYGHDAKSFNIGEMGAPGYLCPAEVSPRLHDQLLSLTRRAAEALEVSDMSRIDFRMGADDQLYLMEINTLPGLNPLISDLCIMAAAENISHHALITEILYLAAERYSMPFDVQSAAWLESSLTQTQPVKTESSLIPEKVLAVVNHKGKH
jgi:D-alanine-D-alanine ligase